MVTNLLDLYSDEIEDPIALMGPDLQPTTYGDLKQQICRTGSAMRAHGLSGDSTVAIALPNGPLVASVFLSVSPWCTAAPLNTAFKADEFEYYLRDLEASALVVEAGSDLAVVNVARDLKIPVLEVTQSAYAGLFHIEHIDSDEVAVPRDGDAIALILHTSGTTSRPKMVPLSQANLCASAHHIASTLALCGDDRCLNIMPLFHIHGLMAPILASISVGASVFCTPGFDALRFYSWLRDVQPTWYSAVPTMHQAILARASRNSDIVRSHQLRFIRSSSASLPPQVMSALEKTFSVPVIEAYAMTEAAHQMCSNPMPPLERKPGSVGMAAGPEVAVAGEAGQLLEVGRVGEVVIRGPNVTAGYLKNDAANKSSYVNGWFRTGDQGVLDEDGYLRITGRLKEIINRGGEKISPLEIDEVLLDHASVAQACTFAVPHERLGEDVAAVIVLEEGSIAEATEIRQFVRSRLADFKTPKQIYFRDEIPKGPTGKVQRIGMAEALNIEI